jgi:hypothetical protein
VEGESNATGFRVFGDCMNILEILKVSLVDEINYKECIDEVRDGVRGPEIIGIWNMWVSLLMLTECRGPFADVKAMHGQQSQRGGVPHGRGAT